MKKMKKIIKVFYLVPLLSLVFLVSCGKSNKQNDPRAEHFEGGEVVSHVVGYRCNCAYNKDDSSEEKELYVLKPGLMSTSPKDIFAKNIPDTKVLCEKERENSYPKNCVPYDHRFKDPLTGDRSLGLRCSCNKADKLHNNPKRYGNVLGKNYEEALKNCQDFSVIESEKEAFFLSRCENLQPVKSDE